MPLPSAPSFGAQEYWNARFTANPNPFEWLEAPNVLDPFLVETLRTSTEEKPDILHIGCGTSLLSYHLRAHVKGPEQIHNLDYSDVAIEVGRKREVEIFALEGSIGVGNMTDGESTSMANVVAKPSESSPGKAPKPTYMRWSSANLLSYASILGVCEPAKYSVIVDKSTSDSIACADDLYVPLPYPIRTPNKALLSASKLSQSPEPIHPVHILAIHLALVTKPSAKWISLSYSEDRFPFLPMSLPTPLDQDPTIASGSTSPTFTTSAIAEEESFEDDLDDDLDNIPQTVLDRGFPDPGLLWRLEAKYDIEVPEQQDSKNGGVTHRPKILHWVYVLVRTDVELFVESD
ncbi:uncharacterized protein BDR25DRAFT_302985 [Lindgomyces ingoldianus]|uniref:Uncharacterized protein n=1 Tax=Lindgomyces ingoldianus TaxID=673940 RepID=A0ACB6R1P6_9PLEO|nr:uncharacterized protein BDR25DRAFT_302985 [Lindgomyces ingoldianus]KAF2472250.1 hypothetical protein BDR25DRAFT_302985 [Lindgomyces ingoldianus]